MVSLAAQRAEPDNLFSGQVGTTFRPGIGLLPMGFCCATSPVVAGALLQPTD